MRACAAGATWAEIKVSLEAMENTKLNDNTVTRLIQNLEDFSFIQNIDGVYSARDRMTAEAFR